MARNQGGDWLRYENPDEKLPWLEPAEEYEPQQGLLKGRLIGALIGIAVVIVLLVAGMSWFLNREESPVATGDAGVIKAPSEPYKVQPTDPGGMYVEGQGDTVYATGAGADPGGTIDLSALPEEPIARSMPGVESGDVGVTALPPSSAAKTPPSAGALAPAAKAADAKAQTSILPPATKPVAAKPHAAPAVPAKPAANLPAAVPASVSPGTGNGSFGLQLGAFSSRAKADAAWKALSGRFTFIGALNKSVEPVGKGDATLYRLRAVGVASRASADNLCGRMKVAGDACTVVAP